MKFSGAVLIVSVDWTAQGPWPPRRTEASELPAPSSRQQVFLRAGARDATITGHLVSLSKEESADSDTTDSDCNGGWTEGACECLSAVVCMTNSLFIPYRQSLKEAIGATACPTNRVAKVTGCCCWRRPTMRNCL